MLSYTVTYHGSIESFTSSFLNSYCSEEVLLYSFPLASSLLEPACFQANYPVHIYIYIAPVYRSQRDITIKPQSWLLRAGCLVIGCNCDNIADNIFFLRKLVCTMKMEVRNT